MSKPKTKKELENLLTSSVRVLQSPANHKNEDRNIKGFVEGLKAALGQYTITEDGILRVDKNLNKMISGLLENRDKQEALEKEASKMGMSVDELQQRKAFDAARLQNVQQKEKAND